MEHKARSMVVNAGKRIVGTGLAAGTWGNVSIRIDDEHMLITPSGMDYSHIRADDIVLVDIHSLESTGKHAPSSETPMHAAIYRKRNEINGIIHTHPQYGCTVAAARTEVPPILDDLAQLIGPSLRVADHAHPGSDKMVRVVTEALEGRNACLLANHGVVCLGRTLDEAFTVSLVVEKACKAYIDAIPLGGAVPFTYDEALEMHKMYMETYSVKDLQEKKKLAGI